VVVALTAWLVGAPDDDGDDFDVTLPATTAGAIEPGAAALALRELERAVAGGDPRAAEAQAASPEAASLLTAVVANAEAARVADVSLRYVDELGAVGREGTWPAAVVVEWRFAGFDRAVASTEVVVEFATADPGGDGVEGGEGAVRIAGIGGEARRTPVWLSGPLAVSRTSRTLVLAADASSLERYVRLAARAVPVVSRVVPDWESRLVVEVPADRAALERALDVEPGFYDQIAAVTGTADGSVAPDAPVHVFVNPDVFDALGPRGQEVVLDHETAHVAGDGPVSRAPTWLVEGYADYVALRDTALPLRLTAAQVRERVRAEGPPTALPGPEEFDTRGPHLGAVYESAWLACQVLADRGGNEAFLEFYDAVSDGSPVSRELRRLFDWSERDLVAAWTDLLVGLPA
jgi:hypothetical protein